MSVPDLPAGVPPTMRACRIHAVADLSAGPVPVELDRVPTPAPGRGELLIEVAACGVCHTELDEIEGRTPPARLPMTPGHQVVGRVVAEGPGCNASLAGKRVGVAWIHSSCGACAYCRDGLENLCADFRGCGRDADGGYAEYMTVPEEFAHPLPDALGTAAAAPLLCAGAVGLRAIRLCELKDGEAIGLTGFGASGHLVLQMLGHLYPASKRYVFARNPDERTFALELGADWAGDTADPPPTAPAAVIDTTPAWRPVLAALEVMAPAGRLVINAIAKEAGDLQEWQRLDYARHLWREKILRTVTNVTRADVRDCLELAAAIPLEPRVRTYPLEQAAQALASIRAGGTPGAAVLTLG